MRKDNMFRSEEAQAVARTTKELESLSDSIDALQDMINSATGAEKQRLQAMEASMQRRTQTLETNQNIATTKFNKKYNTSFASDDISSNVEQQKTAKQTSSKINKAADTLTKSGNLLIDAATKLASVAYDVEFENISARVDMLLADIDAMAQKALLSANLEAKAYTSAVNASITTLSDGINEGAYAAANSLIDLGTQKKMMDLEKQRIDLENKNTKQLRQEQKNANISNLYAQQQQALVNVGSEFTRMAGHALNNVEVSIIGTGVNTGNIPGAVADVVSGVAQGGAAAVSTMIQSENKLYVQRFDNEKKVTEAVLKSNQEVEKVWIEAGSNVQKAWLQYAQKIENSLLKSEAAANDMGVGIGLYGEQLNEFKKTMFSVQIDVSKWGKTLEDMSKLQSAYQSNTGRNISFSLNDFDTSFALDKLTGQDGLSSQLTSSMEIFNHSVSDSNEMFYEMYKNVSKIGLNGRKYLKDLTKNLKLAEKFQFQGGVKGLMNMAKWAQNVRFNMDSLDSVIENFREGGLEGAITKTAGMQVLGGNFAQYADPLAMLWETYNDPEALVKRQNNMMKGMGRFNQKTGEVDFNMDEQLLLQQFAKLTGQSVQDLMNQRRQAIKGNKIEGNLNKNVEWSDTEKSLITNKAQLNNGRWVVTLANGTEKDVSTLSKEDLNHLMPQDNEEKLVSYVYDIRDMMTRLTGAKQYATSQTENATYDTWYDEEIKRINNTISEFNANYGKYIGNVSESMQFATEAQQTMLDMFAQGNENIGQASSQILEEGQNIASTLSEVNQLLNQSLNEIKRRQDEWKPREGEVAYEKTHAENRHLPDNPRFEWSWQPSDFLGDDIMDKSKQIQDAEIVQTPPTPTNDAFMSGNGKPMTVAANSIKPIDSNFSMSSVNDAMAFGNGNPMTVSAKTVKSINDGVAKTNPQDNAIFAKTGGPFDTLFNGVFGRIDEIYNNLSNNSVVPSEPIGKSQFVSSDDAMAFGNGNPMTVSANELASQMGVNAMPTEIIIKPVKVELSGSVRLEANGQSIDLMELLNKNPMLIRQLSQMISDEVGKSINGGRSVTQYDYLRK